MARFVSSFMLAIYTLLGSVSIGLTLDSTRNSSKISARSFAVIFEPNRIPYSFLVSSLMIWFTMSRKVSKISYKREMCFLCGIMTSLSTMSIPSAWFLTSMGC